MALHLSDIRFDWEYFRFEVQYSTDKYIQLISS